ncbi:MAG: hypothetical protein KY446_09775 [Proteobacteria bacterium]|nr:hypothetical protein [Pseudomonadota bacterium]MBW3618019.1 hypothetical protein [Pseudomonadota bacterium]
MLDEDLLSFIQGSIRSVWALELLLLLRREPDRTWTAEDAARELRANARLVSDQFAGLQTAGLIACEAGCRYAPAGPMLDALCARLETAYRERSGQVIKAIMAGPNDKLQIFADAFRLRGDDR